MELVGFETADGLRVDGLFVPPLNDLSIVHVHGKCGNFYQNDFIKPMLSIFEQAGIGFLAFNNRGHDCIAEGYRHGELEYVGGSMEHFDDCLLDIDAAVGFVREFGGDVIVQGHSSGAEKALYYALERPQSVQGIVLLSPSDSYEMQRRFRPRETPEAQIRRLQAMPGGDWALQLLPNDEYGIHVGDKEYEIPVTRDSMLDLLTGPGFDVLRLSRPWTAKATGVRALVCLGGRDPFLTVGPELMRSQVQKRLGNDVTLQLIEDSDHHFRGHQEELASTIANWVQVSEPQNKE